MTEAMTTEAQSVSGIKPIFTSVFSGASEPAAQAVERINGSANARMPRLAVALTVFPSHARRCVSAGALALIGAGEEGLRASVICDPWKLRDFLDYANFLDR